MNNLVNINGGFIRKPSRCEQLRCSSKVYNSILDCVGNTPLVRLNRIPKIHGVSCEIYVKCEFMNPAGSIKDRISKAMFIDARQAGVIKEDTEFVEPTSGNTGIGVAFNAAILGKKCTIVMEEKNSSEKVDTMRLMGAEVLKIKKGINIIARQIKDNSPDNVIMLNQYANHVNPRIHYDTTGAEIIAALDRVDMVCMGAGTGGTISGVGLKLKEEYPNCLVVVGEPEGSVMFNVNGKSHPFLVEGIGGYERSQMVLDESVIDHFEVVTDQEAFLMSREMARTEGILCGGSSGVAMMAAIKAAKTLKLTASKRLVVVLPDGIRNYMSKFVSDQWMEARFFMEPPNRTMSWWNQPISNLVLNHKYPKVYKTMTCEEAVGAMTEANIAVVIDENEHFVGAVTKDCLRHYATNPLRLPNVLSEEFNFRDEVSLHLVKDCYTLAENGNRGKPTIGLLSRILDITPFVVIGDERQKKGVTYFDPRGVVSGEDILDYIYSRRI